MINKIPNLWLGLVLGLSVSSSFALADSEVSFYPSWSEVSVEDAAARCTANNAGRAVGLSTNTLQATGTEFYLVVCQRPASSGGVTYVPAWSASDFANASARCETVSNSTGLPPGVAVGVGVHVQSSKTNIFIVPCETGV